jgi:hypothetical protein
MSSSFPFALASEFHGLVRYGELVTLIGGEIGIHLPTGRSDMFSS